MGARTRLVPFLISREDPLEEFEVTEWLCLDSCFVVVVVANVVVGSWWMLWRWIVFRIINKFACRRLCS